MHTTLIHTITIILHNNNKNNDSCFKCNITQCRVIILYILQINNVF